MASWQLYVLIFCPWDLIVSISESTHFFCHTSWIHEKIFSELHPTTFLRTQRNHKPLASYLSVSYSSTTLSHFIFLQLSAPRRVKPKRPKRRPRCPESPQVALGFGDRSLHFGQLEPGEVWEGGRVMIGIEVIVK